MNSSLFTAVFVHAMRQNTVNTKVFCSGVPKHCKYQRFGLQHAENIANSGVLLKKLEIGAV